MTGILRHFGSKKAKNIQIYYTWFSAPKPGFRVGVFPPGTRVRVTRPVKHYSKHGGSKNAKKRRGVFLPRSKESFFPIYQQQIPRKMTNSQQHYSPCPDALEVRPLHGVLAPAVAQAGDDEARAGQGGGGGGGGGGSLMGRLLLGLRRRVHQGVKTGPGKK